jgi:hypothetical protein
MHARNPLPPFPFFFLFLFSFSFFFILLALLLFAFITFFDGLSFTKRITLKNQYHVINYVSARPPLAQRTG